MKRLKKSSSISKEVKNAVKEMEIIAGRKHYSEEYFQPLHRVMEKILAIHSATDDGWIKIHNSDWAKALVIASFEHAINVIVYQTVSRDPDYTDADLDAEYDYLMKLDPVQKPEDFWKVLFEYSTNSNALPSHEHVLEVLEYVKSGRSRVGI